MIGTLVCGWLMRRNTNGTPLIVSLLWLLVPLAAFGLIGLLASL